LGSAGIHEEETRRTLKMREGALGGPISYRREKRLLPLVQMEKNLGSKGKGMCSKGVERCLRDMSGMG